MKINKVRITEIMGMKCFIFSYMIDIVSERENHLTNVFSFLEFLETKFYQLVFFF